jgi:hypothetical protein
VRRFLFPASISLALVASLLPLWATRHLPAVDAPQHLFLVHVLRVLRDPSSSYHELFEVGPRVTYVTFYQGTALLAGWFGEETALRLWLTLVMGAVPLALAALLRAFGRSPWLALFACPLLYTDGFYWGLFAFHSTVALTLASLAWCVRALEREERRWALLFALALAGLVLTHVAALPLPILGCALFSALTRSTAPRRRRVLFAAVPALALLGLWLCAGVQRGRALDLGEHWSGSGSLLDPANYSFAPLARRARDLVPLLGNGFAGRADFWPVLAWLALVALALLAGLLRRFGRADRSTEVARSDARPLALFASALLCYFALPTDVAGYMYMIHNRFAQLAALCLIVALPRLTGRSLVVVAGLAGALTAAASAQLTVLFARFEREARPFDEVVAALPTGARLMHLVVDPASRVASHAVYLHYAALAALRVDGVPSFSLAQDPSFPVNYRAGARPPGPEWEWRPARFTWEDARWYDHYLVRGAEPARLFGAHASEVAPAARAGGWVLLRRR